MKNLHLPPGDASLLAQLLLARGDPDALGAGGETVRNGARNGGTVERWWMSCPSFYLAKMLAKMVFHGIRMGL